MLSECPACQGKISNQAQSCPHCGHPLSPTSKPSAIATGSRRRQPLFLILATLAFILTLSTPRLLITLPTFATLGCAVISLFRREKASVLAGVVILLSIGLLVANESPKYWQSQHDR
jgi:hypothetical protein